MHFHLFAFLLFVVNIYAGINPNEVTQAELGLQISHVNGNDIAIMFGVNDIQSTMAQKLRDGYIQSNPNVISNHIIIELDTCIADIIQRFVDLVAVFTLLNEQELNNIMYLNKQPSLFENKLSSNLGKLYNNSNINVKVTSLTELDVTKPKIWDVIGETLKLNFAKSFGLLVVILLMLTWCLIVSCTCPYYFNIKNLCKDDQNVIQAPINTCGCLYFCWWFIEVCDIITDVVYTVVLFDTEVDLWIKILCVAAVVVPYVLSIIDCTYNYSNINNNDNNNGIKEWNENYYKCLALFVLFGGYYRTFQCLNSEICHYKVLTMQLDRKSLGNLEARRMRTQIIEDGIMSFIVIYVLTQYPDLEGNTVAYISVSFTIFNIIFVVISTFLRLLIFGCKDKDKSTSHFYITIDFIRRKKKHKYIRRALEKIFKKYIKATNNDISVETIYVEAIHSNSVKAKIKLSSETLNHLNSATQKKIMKSIKDRFPAFLKDFCERIYINQNDVTKIAIETENSNLKISYDNSGGNDGQTPVTPAHEEAPLTQLEQKVSGHIQLESNSNFKYGTSTGTVNESNINNTGDPARVPTESSINLNNNDNSNSIELTVNEGASSLDKIKKKKNWSAPGIIRTNTWQ